MHYTVHAVGSSFQLQNHSLITDIYINNTQQ